MNSQPPYDESWIADILRRTRTIALVGFSDNPDRPSHGVAKFLLAYGYQVFAVNPGLVGKTLLGSPVFGRLADIPIPIDMVDIFRNSEAAGEVVQEALNLTPLPKTIWMQLGVYNEAAAQQAAAKGLDVVMDRCPKIELARLGLV